MKNLITNTNADLSSESAEHSLAHVASNEEWDMPHDVGDEPWDMPPTKLMPCDEVCSVQMNNEPNNSQLGKQDETSDLAHVPAWESQDHPDRGDGSGEDDLADYNQNEASDYING